MQRICQIRQHAGLFLDVPAAFRVPPWGARRADRLLLPPAEELRPWAERAREIAEEPPTEDVYVVTNDHHQGKAIVDALMLRSMVRGERVPAPPPLFARYVGELAPFADPVAPEEAGG